MIRKLGVAILIALAPFQAQSERALASYGVGVDSCGQYLEKRQRDKNSYTGVSAQVYVSWVHGYATGLNVAGEKNLVVESIPTNSSIAYLDKYCRDNPLRSVFAGIGCLLQAKGAQLNLPCK
jgi:hypothetical protein